MEGYNESTRKFGKKFAKESLVEDPALVCPYCGGNNCEVSIGTDDLNFTNLDRLQGETFNVECWCNDCDKPYNVTLELNVKEVYPNEDFSDEYI
jgi:Zn finger protein HypA/HybF involved in hydrogenase expression